MSPVLQFGIPSFDALFGRQRSSDEREEGYKYDAYGIQLSGVKQTTSLSIIGPDGTGKSVFGLHLAAQYMADADITSVCEDGANQKRWHSRVLYVSTDLKHHVAEVMWKNFGLLNPNERHFPFYWAYRQNHPNADREVKLAKLDPADIHNAVLEDGVDPKRTEVHFIDLVSKTMGDDWGFINRLLAVLRMPSEGCAPNLLVIDAVEGFETLVGEKDAFGETTSRRARIAQIMRTAGEKCHVCFIVEEPKTDERFPEEFVTDVVVRLRSVNVNKYARRTVEILKARGQSHVRGQHPFVIRDGNLGPAAKRSENADEPQVKNSYVHIFPSLHNLSREEMKSGGISSPPRTDRVAAFGITYLDEMLARLSGNSSAGFDDQGLRAQTTTALIGEFATQKTSLATAFLARTFRAFTFQLADMIRELDAGQNTKLIRDALTTRALLADAPQGTTADPTAEKMITSLIGSIQARDTALFRRLIEGFRLAPAGGFDIEDRGGRIRFAAWLAEALDDNGAAVLITTSDQDRDRLVSGLAGWLENSLNKAFDDWPNLKHPLDEDYSAPFRNAVLDRLKRRTICRRLELHDLSSATLFQIIQRSVERAQEKVFLNDDLSTNRDRLPYRRAERFRRSWNIRVVLDDLSTLKDAYPEIGSDPIFLPFLLSFLEREGVTSLIVDSQMGRPDAVVTDALDRELRALVLHKILTWRVPFFGQMRDAITVVPPDPSGLPSLVREVRWQAREGGPNALVVDPELELYSGLERGDSPKPIPLEVRLFAETDSTTEYIREQNEVLGRLFTPLGTDPDAKVIIGVEAWPYDALRDFCNLLTHTLLDHTMLFQVDEFWATNRKSAGTTTAQFPRGPVSRREGSLYPLGRYLTEPTSVRAQSKKLVVDRVADPFGVFQGEPISKGVSKEGSEVLIVPKTGPWQRRHYFTRSSQGPPRELRPAELAKIDRVPYTWDFGFLLCPSSMWESAGNRRIGHKEHTVGSVWRQMPNVFERKQQPYVSWRMFLGACKAVAQAQAERTSEPVRSLDVSTLAGESFTCMVLEIWASEILELQPEKRKQIFDSLGHVDWTSPGSESLIDWLEIKEYRLAFYKAWLLLLDVVIMTDVVERQTIPRLKIREADGRAVATRHWYKTACGRQLCPITNELALPVRLPGHFSVRGDWFLAVAGGSRSERLACRALDLFSTRRANFRRMELGIGLPTRDIAEVDSFDKLPTALVKSAQGRTTAVTYGELIGAGIEHLDHFSWLWRSQLCDYHRHSRLLQRWIGQVAEKWDDLRKGFGPNWQSGFEVYDKLEGKKFPEADEVLKDLPSWRAFEELCEVLKTQLKIATLSAPSPEIQG